MSLDPMPCMHCGLPEARSGSKTCIPGFFHTFITLAPGETHAEALAAYRRSLQPPPAPYAPTFAEAVCADCADTALCVLFAPAIRLCAGCLNDLAIQLYAKQEE